ncbi:hypothetical protein [Halalkalibacter alkalisediminis]|uniref:Uncharacterized protein n=1 Tax=Halalkalibacter alkalisediminis TaxID=935616 RepID=A0ABV6NI46_9BACI|nr:hypothetical protein [Halalkalibacter alkalisediminis]
MITGLILVGDNPKEIRPFDLKWVLELAKARRVEYSIKGRKRI